MINFFPYEEWDGVWTMKDSIVVALFEQLEEEGSLAKLFRDGCICSPEEYKNYFKYGSDLLYFYTVDSGEIGGVFWLNGIEGRRCNIHFAALKRHWGKATVIAGQRAILKLLDVWDCILGCIPNDNPLAIQCVKRTGLKEIATIPNAVYDDMLDRSIDATLLCITKEDKEWLKNKLKKQDEA